MMQVVLHLSDALAEKFNQVVPSPQQSEFLTRLLENALSEDAAALENDPIYLAALAVEQDAVLNAEMREWHDACIADGIREHVDSEPEPNELTRRTLEKADRGEEVFRARDSDDLMRQLRS